MGDARYTSLLTHIRETKNPAAEESQVKSLYEVILSLNNGDKILDNLIKPEESFKHSFAVKADSDDEFSASTSASGGLLDLWFYISLDLKAHDIKRRFQGNAFGAGAGLPIGALFGTLWYNDTSELKGSTSFFVGAFNQYVYANFWKGDKHIAVFHSGNVGAGSGAYWGDGDWKEE